MKKILGFFCIFYAGIMAGFILCFLLNVKQELSTPVLIVSIFVMIVLLKTGQEIINHTFKKQNENT